MHQKHYIGNMEDLNQLKLVLVKKKRTNKWLAEQLGVNQTTVSKFGIYEQVICLAFDFAQDFPDRFIVFRDRYLCFLRVRIAGEYSRDENEKE